MFRTVLNLVVLCGLAGTVQAADFSIAPFEADVTPPLGTPLCDGLVPPAAGVHDPLRARGVVLLPADQPPIVLCAVDWVGIGNEAHRLWRTALAEAAGTTADRVAVHCLHQHDAPGHDVRAEELLTEVGLSGKCFNIPHARQAVADVADAIRHAIPTARPVTHIGRASAVVENVASNRRVLDTAGKVKHVRFSASRNPEAVAWPDGVIDPMVRSLSFWSGDTPVACLTYYATHPQSYYGQGQVSADFVGLARDYRDSAVPNVLHVHFNGAGGNVAAGKYNDGAPERRPELAQRLADGMQRAWKNMKKTPVDTLSLHWRTADVVLPLRDHVQDPKVLRERIADTAMAVRERGRAARDLSYTERVLSETPITISALQLGDTYLIHMPGELFVEYQLAAADLHPQGFVAMAAYGDYGPGYIGNRIAYGQGGYETSRVSRTAPEVEGVLQGAMRKVLDAESQTAMLYAAAPLTEPHQFTGGVEGPAVGADGSIFAVNFEREGTIGRVTPDGTASLWVALPDGSTGNGIRINRDGILHVADYTGHNVLRIDGATKAISVFAHNPDFHQPNDLTLLRDGSLYASDPNWDAGTGQVWRVSPTGEVTLAAPDMGTSNGVEVSPDEKFLYVNESVQRKIWKFTIADDGTLTDKTLFQEFPDFGFDGMRCDVDGNLYVTRHGRGTVVKIDPEGAILLEVDVLGSKPSNICFGGPDGKTAYVTEMEHGRLVSFRVESAGAAWSWVHSADAR